MIEKLQPISRVNWGKSAWAVCLWEIMVRESGISRDPKRDTMAEKFGNLFPDAVGDDPKERGELAVNVELKINGVPVSFEKSLEEMWARAMSRFDEAVLDKAKELVSRSRYDKICDIMNRHQWEIEQELEVLYNEDKKG